MDGVRGRVGAMRWIWALAIIGLAAEVVGMAMPQYWPEVPQWIWGLLVWGGLVTMISAVIWAAWPQMKRLDLRLWRRARFKTTRLGLI